MTAVVADIFARYAAGERNFEGMHIDNETHDFSNADLSGASFRHCFIDGIFRGCNLEGTDFSNANVKCCDFSRANLRRALFLNATIDAADFDDANFEGASFEGASEQSYLYAAGELPLRKWGKGLTKG